MKKSGDWIFKEIVFEKKTKIFFVIVIFIITSFFKVYPTKLIGVILNSMLGNNEYSYVLRLIIIYIAFRLFGVLFMFLSSYLNDILSLNVSILIKEKLLYHLVKEDVKISHENSSQINQRIQEYVNKCSEGIKLSIEWIGLSVPVLILTFYYIAMLNIYVFFILVPIIFIMSICSKKISERMEMISVKEQRSRANSFDFVNEIFNGYTTLKLYKSFNYIINLFKEKEYTWKKDKSSQIIIKSVYYVLLSSFGIIVNSMILLFTLNNKVKIGDVTSLILYTGNMFFMVMQLFDKVTLINDIKASLSRYNDLIIEYNKDDNTKDKSLELLDYCIKINNFCLNFDNKCIISDLNIKIDYGEKVLVKGENGSGKSTLLNCISNLLQDYSGIISIGGQDIRNVNKINDNKIITYITQETFLFSIPIIDNILLGRNIEDNELKGIIELLNLETNQFNLKQKIKNNGDNISGGQKQKIAIARGLIMDSKIILVDEITNNLDEKSSNNIINYLLELESTVILVTHLNVNESRFDKVINLSRQ